MNKIVIGLVAELAGGKGAVTDYLKGKHGAVSFRFSDPLRETLEIYDIKKNRKNLQDIAILLLNNFGQDLLSKAMAKKAKESKEELIVIDGVRRFTDIEHLTKLPEFRLVYINTDNDTRYKRYVARNENPGDDKVSPGGFIQMQQAEADKQIPEVGKKAEFTIDNNDSFDNLYKQIEDILEKLKG
jgi:dephospho-CoA kinase